MVLINLINWHHGCLIMYIGNSQFFIYNSSFYVLNIMLIGDRILRSLRISTW